MQILLDKLLAVWYNGNSRCWGVGGAQKSPYGVSTGVVAYVVGICPTLFQHRGLWFTFVFRTPTHRAVGSWGEVLCSSRGSFPLGLPRPRLLYPYYSTSLFSCQGVLENYFRFAWLGKTWLWSRELLCSNSLTHKRLWFSSPLVLVLYHK